MPVLSDSVSLMTFTLVMSILLLFTFKWTLFQFRFFAATTFLCSRIESFFSIHNSCKQTSTISTLSLKPSPISVFSAVLILMFSLQYLWTKSILANCTRSFIIYPAPSYQSGVVYNAKSNLR